MIDAVFVDDNPDIIAVIQTVARHEGVNARVFDNGSDALNYLTGSRTDVVVLDLMLPVLDGLTIAEEIRRNEEIRLIQPPVKLAFLTAATINDAIERVAERCEVKAIFRKPVEYAAVFREIKTWCEE